MGRSRYKIIEQDAAHFVTLTVLHWIPIFTRPQTVDILLESLRFLMKDGLKVHAYVILENHLHLIVQSPQLIKDMARFKSFTAKKILNYLEQQNVKTILEQLEFYKKIHKRNRQYQFWQEGIHPELILNDAMMLQKIEYIHHNPVKRGYVEQAGHWRYSSARDYEGEVGLIDIDKCW